MKPVLDVCKALAGDYFDILIASKDDCTAHLQNADPTVRLAAITVYGSVWADKSDSEFFVTSQRMAVEDPDPQVRAGAIGPLGAVFRSTQDASVSRFLADLARDDRNTDSIKISAYWALREVQFGLTDEELIKRGAQLAKASIHRLAPNLDEERVREAWDRSLISVGSSWAHVDDVDWDLVRRWATVPDST